jgi:hypothetical protein
MLIWLESLLLNNLIHPIDSVVVFFKARYMSLEKLMVFFDHLDSHSVSLTLRRQAFVLFLKLLNIPF